MIPLPRATFLAKPIVKFGVPVLVIIISILVFQFIWLPAHDRAVRAEYLLELREQARVESEKAASAANEKQELRDDAFEKSQANLVNAADPDSWAERLRAEQCRTGKIAAPC
jgi:hypothetical protein